MNKKIFVAFIFACSFVAMTVLGYAQEAQTQIQTQTAVGMEKKTETVAKTDKKTKKKTKTVKKRKKVKKEINK